MRYILLAAFFSFFLAQSTEARAQEPEQVAKNDSLILAQAYINLHLTGSYFDSLNTERLSKILPYEEGELSSIKDTNFLSANAALYHFSHAMLYLNKSKFLFRNRSVINRNHLVQWHKELGKAINHFNLAKVPIYDEHDFFATEYYELIKFDDQSCWMLQRGIRSLKFLFTPFFQEDIYPDYKRIFFAAKQEAKFYFDSLAVYASMYNMPTDTSILANQYYKPLSYFSSYLSVENEYPVGRNLDLISRYLQLKYLATDKKAGRTKNFNLYNLYESYRIFIEDLDTANISRMDDFFRKELNAKVCNQLYRELQKKFPYKYSYSPPIEISKSMKIPENDYVKRYFFPNPAPLPSAFKRIPDYKPAFSLLGQVDSSLNKRLQKAGYSSLHYYYHLDGFALATALEKFNKDGSPVSKDKRWVSNMGSEDKFSYFEVFKSLFFETASEFRMFVFTVGSKNVTVSSAAMSAGRAEQLLINSYPELPDDLKQTSLPNKNLTILVYHFHQNDIGLVPELDVSNKMKVDDHLKMAGLSGIEK